MARGEREQEAKILMMNCARQRWATIVPLVLVAGTLAPPLQARAAREPSPPLITLASETRVVASKHSLALLSVPEDVSLKEMRIRIAGGGRVAGYALTNRTGAANGGDVLVQSFIFNRCLDPGCPPAKQRLQMRWAEGLKNGVLREGTYRLYIVADQAPVTVTFRNRTLRGHATLRLPGNHADIELLSLPTSVTTTDDGAVFSAGAFTSLERGRGIGMLGLWALGRNFAGGAFGNCFYFSDTLAPREDTAFVPGCPTGWSPSHSIRGPGTSSSTDGIVYQSTHHRLPHGIGGWAVSAAQLDDVGAVGLWVRF